MVTQADPRPLSFDVVYYPQLVIAEGQTLTILSLLCDRIWLPGLHLPSDVVPLDEIEARLGEMEGGERNVMKRTMWRLLREFCGPRRILKEVFVLTGEHGYAGKTEPGIDELAHALEDDHYGPSPPGFFPIYESGFSAAVGSGNSINGPSVFVYPANATAVALKYDLPLVTDIPQMPSPVSHEAPAARALAFALALAAVKMVLPKIKAVHPEQILEARSALRSELLPFRAAMLRLSSDLRQALGAGEGMDALAKEARFLVETRVLPELEVLRARLEDKRGYWRERLVDLTMASPEISQYWASSTPGTALARTLGRVMEVFQKARKESRESMTEAKTKGLTYLLQTIEQTVGWIDPWPAAGDGIRSGPRSILRPAFSPYTPAETGSHALTSAHVGCRADGPGNSAFLLGRRAMARGYVEPAGYRASTTPTFGTTHFLTPCRPRVPQSGTTRTGRRCLRRPRAAPRRRARRPQGAERVKETRCGGRTEARHDESR